MKIKCEYPKTKESMCKLNEYLLDIRLPFEVTRKKGKKAYEIEIEKLAGFSIHHMYDYQRVFMSKCAQCTQCLKRQK